MKKRMFIVSIIFLLVIGMCGNVKATDLKTKLEVIKENSETKYLENDQGYLDKKIVSYNGEEGEVTINLTLNNSTSETTSENKKYDETEIYILIPEPISKYTEKMTQYSEYIETMATKVFEKNKNTKIGIVGIKGPIEDYTYDGDRKINGEKDESFVEGTAENAEIVVSLTNNVSNIKNELQKMNDSKTNYYINVQAAIRLAKNSYSDNVNKILISLFDDAPSTAIGVCNGFTSTDENVESAAREKIKEVVEKTKSEILSLQSSNIDFILLRPDDTNYDQKWYNSSTGELAAEFDGSSYIKELYGSLENPTYGKMYSLNNDNLEKIVTENIYEDIMKEVGTELKSVTIKDYFPKEILNNFDITISNKNALDIDTKKLNDDGYIIWNINTLERNKIAKLEYTLKIKDMNNIDLLNKTISTNEKVELTYTDCLDKNVVVTQTTSPQIQLKEVQTETETNKGTMDDDTTAKSNLPQTGVSMSIIAGIVAIAIVLIVAHKKYEKYKDIK